MRTKTGAAQRYGAKAEAGDDDAIRRRRASTNRTLTILKAALNKAWRGGKVASDAAWRRLEPFEGADAARVRYLTIAEAKRLINASKADFRLLVRAALATGARYGELADLRVSDFNPDSGTLHIRTSKSGKGRHIVLADEGVSLFASQAAGRPTNAVLLPKEDGGEWKSAHQARPMKAACKSASIDPEANFHCLRHTYASHAIMNGAPLLVVAKNLGHSDTRMVERHYGHLAPSYIADAIRRRRRDSVLSLATCKLFPMGEPTTRHRGRPRKPRESNPPPSRGRGRPKGSVKLPSNPSRYLYALTDTTIQKSRALDGPSDLRLYVFFASLKECRPLRVGEFVIGEETVTEDFRDRWRRAEPFLVVHRSWDEMREDVREVYRNMKLGPNWEDKKRIRRRAYNFRRTLGLFRSAAETNANRRWLEGMRTAMLICFSGDDGQAGLAESIASAIGESRYFAAKLRPILAEYAGLQRAGVDIPSIDLPRLLDLIRPPKSPLSFYFRLFIFHIGRDMGPAHCLSRGSQ